MSGHVFGFGGRRDGMRSVSRHWLLVITSALSVDRDGEKERQQGNSCSDLSEWCQCLGGWGGGNMQRDLDPCLIRVKEAPRGWSKKCWPGCVWASEHDLAPFHHHRSAFKHASADREREMLQSHFLPLSGPVPNLWDGSRGDGALTSISTHLNANYLQLCPLLSTEVYHVSVDSETLSWGCQLRPIWSNDVCCQVTFPPAPSQPYCLQSHPLPLLFQVRI